MSALPVCCLHCLLSIKFQPQAHILAKMLTHVLILGSVSGPVGCDTKQGQCMDRKPRRTTFNPFGSICKLLLLGYVLVFIAVFLWLSSPLVVSLLSFPLHFLGSAATRLSLALLCILDLLLRWPLQFFSHQVCMAVASPLASAINLGLNFLSGSSWHSKCVYFVISPPQLSMSTLGEQSQDQFTLSQQEPTCSGEAEAQRLQHVTGPSNGIAISTALS
jgi:hypothetical protein